MNSSRHVAMAMEIFLNNANGPSNHHTKFEIFLIYLIFYKQVIFPYIYMVFGKNMPTIIQTYGKISQIFIGQTPSSQCHFDIKHHKNLFVNARLRQTIHIIILKYFVVCRLNSAKKRIKFS